MKSIISLLTVLSTILSSCSKDGDSYEESKNYIMSYMYDIKQASVRTLSQSNTYLLSIEGTQAYWVQKPNNKYEEYSILFGDVSFNKPFVLMFVEPVLVDTITKIDFISKQSFNPAYPPNSNINALINLNYASVKEYIDSKYTDKTSQIVLNEPLTLFNENNHILLSSHLQFTFIDMPKNTGIYDLIIIGYNKNKEIFKLVYQLKIN